MSILDILALVIIGLSLAVALLKGLLAELLRLAGVVAGLYLAVFAHPRVAGLLEARGVGSLLSRFVAFIVIFLLVMMAGAVAGYVTDRFLRVLHLKWIDRLLGGIFGLLRGWLIVSVVLMAFTVFQIRVDLIERSRFAGVFLASARLVAAWTPSDFRQSFEQGYRRLYRVWTNPTT